VRCEVLVVMAVLCCSVHVASKKNHLVQKKGRKVLKKLTYAQDADTSQYVHQ
jgi:hypothetical protein